MRRTDTLILGGGPAGSAAAIGLAAQGMRPLLLERQRETGDALCGGFLSWHSLAALDRIGLNALRGASADHLRLFAGAREARAPLPRPALGVSRRQLDAALLARAEQLGAAVERGVLVQEVNGTRARTDSGEVVGTSVLLATGKHDVRGLARPRTSADPALGLRVRLGPSPTLTRLIAGAIELHLFDRGYAGLVMQEDGCANLCLAVRKSRLAEAGGVYDLLSALGREVPALGERLAWLENDQSDAIGAVPYGWRISTTEPGLFRLGDQAGVIPSLAGEGMSIALASGGLAARYVIRGKSTQSFQQELGRRMRRPILVAQAVLAAAERPLSGAVLVGLTRVAPQLATLLARVTRVEH